MGWRADAWMSGTGVTRRERHQRGVVPGTSLPSRVPTAVLWEVSIGIQLVKAAESLPSTERCRWVDRASC